MIPVKSIGPKSCFINRPDKERILKAIEIVERMKLEREAGCKVRVTVEWAKEGDSP